MNEQIVDELKIFESSGITLDMLDDTIKAVPELCCSSDYYRYQIIDRKVYGPTTSNRNLRGLLEKVAKLYPVPDVDIICYTQDFIWSYKKLPGPVLATCKLKDNAEKIIHLPIQEWELYEQDVLGIEKEVATSPWASKISKMIWRGSNDDAPIWNEPKNDAAPDYNNRGDWTLIPRGKLCYLSTQFPEFIDAGFTKTYPWTLREDLQPEFFQFFPKKPFASWEENIHHKYLISLEGSVASTPGLAWKLLSNCTLFNQKTDYTLWFDRILTPWVHYIPVNHDLSDLLEKLQWAQDHDDQAKQIADNGRQLAKDNFLPEHAYLYCYKVLKHYAELQKFKPKARS